MVSKTKGSQYVIQATSSKLTSVYPYSYWLANYIAYMLSKRARAREYIEEIEKWVKWASGIGAVMGGVGEGILLKTWLTLTSN